MPEERIEDPKTRKMRVWAVAGVVALFVVCESVELGRASTFSGDEKFYVYGAHHMVESGDWLVPRYDTGALRFEKPALSYWVAGAPMRLFGIGLWQVRLGSLLFVLGAIPFMYALAMNVLKDRAAALLSVVVHVSNEVAYSNAVRARTDSILAFFVLASMFFFSRLFFRKGGDLANAILAYACLAGAVMTKGLAGLAFIGLPVLVFMIVRWRSIGRLRWRAVFSPWGFAAFLALAAPWYVLILVRHGKEFLAIAYMDQVSVNVTGSKLYLLVNPFMYVWLLFKSSLPWSIIALLALIFDWPWVKDSLKERSKEWSFPATWLLTMIAILWLGNSRRERYLLPIMPVCSMFIALVLTRMGSLARDTEWAKGGLRLVALAGCGVGIVCFGKLLFHLTAGVRPDIGAGVAGVSLTLVSVYIWGAAKQGEFRVGALAVGAMMLVLMLCVKGFLTAGALMVPAHELGRELLADLPKSTPVASVGLPDHVSALLLLGSGRKMDTWTNTRDLAKQRTFLDEFMAKGGPRVAVIAGPLYRGLSPETLAKYDVLGSRSAVGGLKVKEWLGQPGRTLRSLLDASKVTLYALLKPGPADRSPRAGPGRPL